MKTMKYFLFILFFLFIKCEFLKIEGNFKYCRNKGEILEYQKQCNEEKTLLKKLECVVNINNFLLITRFNDQYFEIELMGTKLVIYSFAGDIYSTNCLNISQIEIIEKVSNCTRDLLISFTFFDLKKTGYLSKQAIIRDNSEYIECPSQIEYFDTIDDQIELIRYQNLITVQRNSKKKQALVIDDQIENLNMLYEFYERNRLLFIFFCFVIFFKLLLLGYILLTSDNKFEDVLFFLKARLFLGLKSSKMLE